MKETFITHVLNYCNDRPLAESLWNELETAYTNDERHFHTLSHLEHLLAELSPIKPQIADWDTLLFSIVYHDVEYDVAQYILEANNEERSAARAEKNLTAIGFPSDKIQACKEQILATKVHHIPADSDTNFFTDADLSILGAAWEEYSVYSKNIRKEFIVYPDPIYQAGRIKVLKHFLRLPRLYKTDHFYTLYEQQARENIAQEIELLLV